MQAGGRVVLSLSLGYTTALLVLKGSVTLNESEAAGEGDLAVFERSEETISLGAQEEATLLLLNGEPIDEPLVGYGPFVMNTQAEIREAIDDYRSGRMGGIAAGKLPVDAAAVGS